MNNIGTKNSLFVRGPILIDNQSHLLKQVFMKKKNQHISKDKKRGGANFLLYVIIVAKGKRFSSDQYNFFSLFIEFA